MRMGIACEGGVSWLASYLDNQVAAVEVRRRQAVHGRLRLLPGRVLHKRKAPANESKDDTMGRITVAQKLWAARRNV